MMRWNYVYPSLVIAASYLFAFSRCQELSLCENRKITKSEHVIVVIQCSGQRIVSNLIREMRQIYAVDQGQEYVIIEIGNTSIQTIENQYFSNMSLVIELNLADNNIANISSNAFSGVPKVKQMTLSNNKIKTFQKHTFQHLSSLEKLFLDRNQIQQIGVDDFTGLSSLHLLDLEMNNITKVTSGALKDSATTLQSLRLNHNEIRHIHGDVFAHLVSLHMIDLQHNVIIHIESGAFSHKDHLETINLHHNDLELIHERVFSDLPSLKNLDLTDNPLDCMNSLKNLPAYINNLKLPKQCRQAGFWWIIAAFTFLFILLAALFYIFGSCSPNEMTHLQNVPDDVQRKGVPDTKQARESTASFASMINIDEECAVSMTPKKLTSDKTGRTGNGNDHLAWDLESLSTYDGAGSITSYGIMSNDSGASSIVSVSTIASVNST